METIITKMFKNLKSTRPKMPDPVTLLYLYPLINGPKTVYHHSFIQLHNACHGMIFLFSSVKSFYIRYRRKRYNLNVIRQSACLVFNPIMVDNYAAFFNRTPVCRALDSMMSPA